MTSLKSRMWKHNLKALEIIEDVLTRRSSIVAVQPTGSGKSWLMFGLMEGMISFNPNLNVVIVQPLNSIEYSQKNSSAWNTAWEPNVRYTTYSMLSHIRNYHSSYFTDNNLSNIDLLVLDEVHHIDAPQWSKGYSRLKDLNPNMKVLGLTATPIRYLDGGVNVVDKYFDGQSIQVIDLKTAIKEGIFCKPIWVGAYYDLENTFAKTEELLESSGLSPYHKLAVRKLYRSLRVNWKKQPELGDIIDKHIALHLPHKSNLKFPVFMGSINEIKNLKELVISWFKKNNIRKNIVVHELYTGAGFKDAEVLSAFNEHKEDTVDLLFVVNKLNEGVHFDYISGIIMLRATESPTLFLQHLGRALSVGMEHSPLIFDFVNNHRSIKIVHETLLSEEDKLRRRTSTLINPRNGKKHSFDGWDYVTGELHEEMRDITALLEEISTRVEISVSHWEDTSDASWLESFNKTADFILTNHRLPLLDSDDFAMKSWFLILKDQYENKLLPEWKLDKVKSVFPEQ